MAVSISRPSGRRADDVRALRFRFRRLEFSADYKTGGETITARDVSLVRILAVIPLDHLVRPANAANGDIPVFDVAADGRSVTLRLIEDAAGSAGDPFGQEKTNQENYASGAKLDVIFVGE